MFDVACWNMHWNHDWNWYSHVIERNFLPLWPPRPPRVVTISARSTTLEARARRDGRRHTSMTCAGLSRTAICNRLCSFGCRPVQLLARRFGTNIAAEHVGHLRIAERARRAGSGQCLHVAAAAAGIAASAAAMQGPCASTGSATQATGTWAWSSDLRKVTPLQVRGDPYDGVAVIPSSIASDPATFGEQLDLSIEGWIASRRRGVWLKIPIEKSGLIEVAVDRGFIFHHAEQAYVMLTRWLPDGPSQLPANASTQVGVGAVVVNDDGGVLLVQEAVGPLRGEELVAACSGCRCKMQSSSRASNIL